MGKSRFIFYCFLLPVLLSVLPAELLSQVYGTQTEEGNSGNALNRLIEISNQLSNLNEKLRSELQDSRQNSMELQTMLESSRRELSGLKSELETLKLELTILRTGSAELSIKTAHSQTELTALREALRKAESSLTSLELSFEVYRKTAETRISVLARQKGFWKWSCIAAGVLAAGFGTAWLVDR